MLRDISAKGQHEHPASAAFAFKRTGIALNELYGHSLPSDTKPPTSKSLQLDLESC